MKRLKSCYPLLECRLESEERKLMARKALLERCLRTPKFKVRVHNRCQLCGRPRGYLRKFGMCRICLRTLVREGKIPGVIKASW